MLEREKNKKDTWHIKTKNTCLDSKHMYVNFKKTKYFEILIYKWFLDQKTINKNPHII